jgi:hypothetical protein
MLIRFTDCTNADNNGLCGHIKVNANMNIRPHISGDLVDIRKSNVEIAYSPGMASGILGISNNTFYRNGTAEAGSGSLIDYIGSNDIEEYIMAINDGGNPVAQYGEGSIQAVAIYKRELNASENLAVATALALL